MITEDYVSFETAKLLKEKGFREVTNRYYNAQYKEIRTTSDTFMMDWNDDVLMDKLMMSGAVSIPTLQMAMKWLREVHDIHITIYYSAFLYGTHPYYWSIDKMDSIPRANTQIETSTNTHDYSFAHYEKACKSAIKYCLENLI